jgi:predicted nucleotidyltransferase component of viral defense system
MIAQRNLSLLSNRLAREGGRRIPEAVLERDYCLAWFLVGLSRSTLRARMAFKGGTAIKRCYVGDYRFSEDLDFTLIERKLEFRGRTLATLGEEFRKMEARLKRLWTARLAAQMVRLPQFDGVFRAVQRSLRQAGLIG